MTNSVTIVTQDFILSRQGGWVTFDEWKDGSGDYRLEHSEKLNSSRVYCLSSSQMTYYDGLISADDL